MKELTMLSRSWIAMTTIAHLMLPIGVDGQTPQFRFGKREAWNGRDSIAAGIVDLSVVVPSGRIIVTRGTSSRFVFELRLTRATQGADTALVTPAYTEGWKVMYGPEITRLELPVDGPPVEVHLEVPVAARTLVVDVADSGEVYVDNFPGALEIRVKRGSAEVFDIVGPALVEMQHGPINATVAENGIGGALSLLTRRGDIMLTMARYARANIDAETRRGMIVSNFSMPGLDPWGKLSPSTSSRRVLGRIGNANAVARLVSLEGGIMIIRSTFPGRAERRSMP